ncbi:hypothetical protein [Niveispirillum sp. BGYR6]|uniref:hypothetical protein n=1 Tax=Niveispirillum sp. BGYR6 TaxID=2971249 RepID=UPI0022B96178|nr:hypothetical protein [Niveispirillum sp. BGYR6]MDG5493283.1 hypothetical protein [Niveispirillum sp. BGYR6]
MMKLNPILLTLAADNALKRLENPRHRAIVANYRLHAMLEVAGRWPEIFVPELTVEDPFYRVSSPVGVLELRGTEQVQSFYKGLEHAATTVMLLEHEELVVDDWGFASEALYHTFMSGESAIARGLPDADPTKKYIEHRWICMVWPYDDKARMIGERVYPAHTASFTECPEEDFLTLDDVRRSFDPLIAEAQAALRRPA